MEIISTSIYVIAVLIFYSLWIIGIKVEQAQSRRAIEESSKRAAEMWRRTEEIEQELANITRGAHFTQEQYYRYLRHGKYPPATPRNKPLKFPPNP